MALTFDRERAIEERGVIMPGSLSHTQLAREISLSETCAHEMLLGNGSVRAIREWECILHMQRFMNSTGL